MWIERNAMAANAGARIERHEPKRLRRRRANHFPSVDVQRITKPGHLVRHADVYGSEKVLPKVFRLPLPGRNFLGEKLSGLLGKKTLPPLRALPSTPRH